MTLLRQSGGKTAKLSWKIAVREENSHALASHLLGQRLSKDLLVIGQEPSWEFVFRITDSHRPWLKQGHSNQHGIDSAWRPKATANTRIQFLGCSMFLLLFLRCQRFFLNA